MLARFKVLIDLLELRLFPSMVEMLSEKWEMSIGDEDVAFELMILKSAWPRLYLDFCLTVQHTFPGSMWWMQKSSWEEMREACVLCVCVCVLCVCVCVWEGGLHGKSIGW